MMIELETRREMAREEERNREVGFHNCKIINNYYYFTISVYLYCFFFF